MSEGEFCQVFRRILLNLISRVQRLELERFLIAERQKESKRRVRVTESIPENEYKRQLAILIILCVFKMMCGESEISNERIWHRWVTVSTKWWREPQKKMVVWQLQDSEQPNLICWVFEALNWRPWLAEKDLYVTLSIRQKGRKQWQLDHQCNKKHLQSDCLSGTQQHCASVEAKAHPYRLYINRTGNKTPPWRTPLETEKELANKSPHLTQNSWDHLLV